MAGKATSVYVTITENHKTVLHRKFLNANDANAFLKENETKYPKPQYQIIKEVY
jgi:hypothetical protein